MASAENTEITEIVNRLLDGLSVTISSQTGADGVTLRRKIGDMRANYFDYINDDTFAANLLDIFTVAREADAKLSGFVQLREMLFTESPVGVVPKLIVQMAIGFCLGAESRLITLTEFASRDAVEDMIATMKLAFDTARDLAADALDSLAYQNLVFLSGALTNHLATISRPLPRIVTFRLATGMPALALSNRVYYVADRAEEIVAENHVIHPAFCPNLIRGLAS